MENILMETNFSSMDLANTAFSMEMLSSSKFFSGYSRWDELTGQYESWDQAVERVMAMHSKKFADIMTPKLASYMYEVEDAYKEQLLLGAQRALQFGGEQLLRHEAKMYNCAASAVDRVRFFQECMYLLLCGCGVGFSVQQRHISKLPRLVKLAEYAPARVFTVEDSIEGWADAFGVLLSSYFAEQQTFPEFQGCKVYFDLSKIRPKGAPISGGFKAPGPEPLRLALERCRALLDREFAQQQSDTVAMRSIVAYDFVMHMSDAVLSGGIRRAATLCLFDRFDEEMLKAKTGNWLKTNPQRGRSNNSVVLKRDEISREEFSKIMEKVRDYGEPGFVFVEDYDALFNPCVEIGLYPYCLDTGESGFQFCNLVEGNGTKCVDKATFLRMCRAGAIAGTLQAAYTNFRYVSDATRRITEREALLGVSITGWMNNPQILFDEAILTEGAELVKSVNEEVAKLLGINPAARTTCCKPAGNTSVLLKSASGIHGEHAPMYFRNVQLNKEEPVAQLFMKRNPKMVEESVWSANKTDIVVSFPVVAPKTSIFKSDLMGIKQLEYVKKAQRAWVNAGTNIERCVKPHLRHNVSNTIPVDDWSEVEEYLYENRAWFAGVSLLAARGDKAYVQAPFTEVHSPAQLVSKYGEASLFASGLIVDGLHAFNDNLWTACDQGSAFAVRLTPEILAACPDSPEFNAMLNESVEDVLQRDWVRRYHKFANNFFSGNLLKAEFCLKDVFNLHKWVGIMNSMVNIDFAKELCEQRLVDVDTMGSQACAGGACEVQF